MAVPVFKTWKILLPTIMGRSLNSNSAFRLPARAKYCRAVLLACRMVKSRLIPAQNPPMAEQKAAQAGFEGQFKVLEQTWSQTNGAGRAHGPVRFAGGSVDERGKRLSEENGGSVHPNDFAEPKQKLFQEAF